MSEVAPSVPGDDVELTLHEVAELLSVHYMTVYRYVRLGHLRAFKSGGTWRVHPSEVLVFQSGNAVTSSMVTDDGARREAPWSERFEARLLAGDRHGSWGVLERALASGSSIQDAYLDVVAPAMRAIGERWADGQLDIAVEHRATSICTGLVSRLGSVTARRGRTKGVIVVGAVPGERHCLPLSILTEYLRLEGWDVCDLGADVPAQSFVYAIDNEPELVAVAVSVTLPAHLSAAQAVIAAMRTDHPGLAVALGGIAVRDHQHALSLGAQYFAVDARNFVAVLADLVKQPRFADA